MTTRTTYSSLISREDGFFNFTYTQTKEGEATLTYRSKIPENDDSGAMFLTAVQELAADVTWKGAYSVSTTF